MKVCEKVRNKGFTSYNEVADELVLEFATGIHGSPASQVCMNSNKIGSSLNIRQETILHSLHQLMYLLMF
jgi:hypothetical protein